MTRLRSGADIGKAGELQRKTKTKKRGVKETPAHGST